MTFLHSAGISGFSLVIGALMAACGGGGSDTGGGQTTGATSTIFVGDPLSVGGSADGTGGAARLSANPVGLATDSAGNLYVADTGNDTIRKVTPAAVVTTLAGTAGARGSADGTGAAARFDGPTAVATDSAGNVFVADSINQAVRKVTSSGVVTTVARFTGGAVQLSVAADAAGNVYVGSVGSVLKVTSSGAVSTLAGGATPAFGFGNLGVAADSAGNVYVADTASRVIRKVTPAGVVTTLAGTAGVQGRADGTGAAASFGAPVSLTLDGSGNLYVADFVNLNVRKVTPAGVVTTVTTVPGTPFGVAISGSTLYVSFPYAIQRVVNVP